MFRLAGLFLFLVLAFNTHLSAQYPSSRYSRSYSTPSSTYYMNQYNARIGRSYSTRSSTYYQNRYGSSVGRSYTTRAGNTYYFNTRKSPTYYGSKR